MKVKETIKKHRKKIIILAIGLILVLAMAVGVIVFFVGKKENSLFSFFGQNGMGGEFSGAENMITASGVTSAGVTEENFEVENLSTELQIEEVYITANDEITEGTKILKLSEEDVAEAREELEKALKKADLAYRAGSIAYEQSKITAQYDRDSAVLAGEQAEQIYEETISGLEASVENAQKELEDAQEQIAEYESYVKDGSYKTYFKVDEYQALYDENLELLKKKMEEWGVTWAQVVSGSGAGSNMTMTSETMLSEGFAADTVTRSVSGGNGGGASQSSQYVQVLSSLYNVLEQNLRDLEQATNEYEEAVANAEFELQTLQLRLPELKKTLTEAKESYETQILQAKLTYETALSDAERADRDYETALEKAETEYETLKNTLEDAEENLEVFENSVGDGYFYASGSGSVLRSMVRAGQNLSAMSTIFVYSNPEEMSVTVSVSQDSIAQIAVGDTAFAVTDDYRSYEGVVKEFNPVTTSDSRTNVTYDVTISLSGDLDNLSANQSVTVVFGVDNIDGLLGSREDMAEKPEGEDFRQGEGTSGEGDSRQGEGMPEGENFQQGEGMPEEGDFQQGEGMPEGEDFRQGEGMPGEGDFRQGEGMPEGEDFRQGEGMPGEGDFQQEQGMGRNMSGRGGKSNEEN